MRKQIIATMIFLGLAGCRTGTPPLAQIQFCLTPNRDADVLKETLQQIAEDEHLDYLDWSSETQKQLENIKDNKFNVEQSFPIINVSVRRNDGLGFGGGNIGFPTDQVTFGFTSGSNKKEAKQLASRVIARLGRDWHVHQIPEGRGAFPLRRC